MDGLSIIVGNACSLLAMVTDSVSSTRKTAKGVLMVQSLSQLIYCIGAIVLQGYSAAVQNAVSIVRNILAMRKLDNKVVQWALVALGVVLGLVFNNLGWIGLLPVIANFQYTLAVFRFSDNERALKVSFALAVFLFGIFNLAIMNLVGFVTNLVVAVTTVVYLIRTRKQTQEEEK